MASKRSKLLERVEQTRRAPQPARILEAEPQKPKKGFKPVTIVLYTPELRWADELTLLLQRAGIAKANRSLVIREAVLRLQEDLDGKSKEDVLRFFLERQAQRSSS